MGNINIGNVAAIAALAAVVSPRRLFFKADEETIVEEGDPSAAFLAVGKGSQTTDPRVIAHLGLDVPDALKGVAAPAPRIKMVETEQSPTSHQIALEAASVTDASAPEVTAIEAKEKTEGTTPEADEAKQEIPLENRGTEPVQGAKPLAIEGVDQATLDALAKAGYGKPEAIKAADDERLRTVPGVDDAVLAKLRAVQ